MKMSRMFLGSVAGGMMTVNVVAGGPESNDAQLLRTHVEKLAGEIGPRNLVAYDNLNRAADYIVSEFRCCGLAPEDQQFSMPAGKLRSKWEHTGYSRQIYRNIVVEIKGTVVPEQIVVIGAHYDSVALAKGLCRGANDNASGVAALLLLARYFATHPQPATIRLVAFANEEPPFFWTVGMGSDVYARRCRANGDKVVAMLALDSIGCYSDVPGSQRYPVPGLSWLHSDRGNFIAFVSSIGSRRLQQRCVTAFRRSSHFPVDGAALPLIVPRIGASDHFSFIRVGYLGVMVTDTAPYRDVTYHTPHDDPAHLDYDRLKQVADGLRSVVIDLAR